MEESEESRPKEYNSRLTRARAANQEKRTAGKSLLVSASEVESAFDRKSSYGQLNIAATESLRITAATPPITPQNSDAFPSPLPRQYSAGTVSSVLPPLPQPPVINGEVEVYLHPKDGPSISAWEWSEPNAMMAVMDNSQLLRVVDSSGKTIYRVQLPSEGRVVYLGWEPSGSALAAVQNHGGAYLWFPSRPDSVQQWEGMQFSSQVLKSSVLKRNSHFNTCFACWSPTFKLVLGLQDGNFAVWDLTTNETFISRKHFAGKHKNPITCGAWGLDGHILALGSVSMLKVSHPLQSASWEVTAAKLALPENGISFQELSFSSSSRMLAALAGSSVFRHLCLYVVRDDGKKKGGKLEAVGEIHPNTTVGAISSTLWLPNEVLAIVTTNGFLQLVLYDQSNGVLVEEKYKVCDSKVAGAVFSEAINHVVMTDQDYVYFFDPLFGRVASRLPLPPPPDGNRYSKLQCSKDTLLLARTDAFVFRLKLPALKALDLSLLTVRPTNKEATADASAEAMTNASCSAIRVVLSVSEQQGASTSGMYKLHHSFSIEKGLLALVNSDNDLLIIRATGEGGALLPRKEDEPPNILAREKLPVAECSFFEWDPAIQSVLAISMRGYGIVFWMAETFECQMWAGMQYKSSIVSMKQQQKDFDPLFSKWNKAGQLAAGMSDGSFAVYDSINSQVFCAGKSGKHSSGITAGDWISSYFAPALALASTNVIKVSQGFDNVEWPATAMKLKLGKENERSSRYLTSPSIRKSRVADPEGLCFDLMRFSPTGKYLATIAFPNPAPSHKQVVVYELQDKRESLVPVREVETEDESIPFSLNWITDNTLLVFCQGGAGPVGSCVKIVVVGAHASEWPPAGKSLPGRLVQAAATTRGLLAMAFETSNGKGSLLIVRSPSMMVLAEYPLDRAPASMELLSTVDSSTFVSIGFVTGGVVLFEIVP